MMLAFTAGLAAGLLHVVSGPDHLAAVAPLVAGGNRHPALSEMTSHEVRGHRVEGWRTGFQWGIGHTAGVLFIATLLLAIRDQLPLAEISAYGERLVGVALIAVGSWGVWKANRVDATTHAHRAASFAMGAVHGVAGSSHLFGVLPALAFATNVDSLLYLSGFGLAAIVGMSAFAAGLGAVSLKWGGRNRWLFASSAAALVVGGFWLVAH